MQCYSGYYSRPSDYSNLMNAIDELHVKRTLQCSRFKNCLIFTLPSLFLHLLLKFEHMYIHRSRRQQNVRSWIHCWRRSPMENFRVVSTTSPKKPQRGGRNPINVLLFKKQCTCLTLSATRISHGYRALSLQRSVMLFSLCSFVKTHSLRKIC